MKKLQFFIIGFSGLLIFACTPKQKQLKLTCANSSAHSFSEQVVKIPQSSLMDEGQKGKYPVIKDEAGTALPYQFYDENSDGQWDDMLLLVNLDKNQTKNLAVEYVDENQLPQVKQMTNIRFASKNPVNELTTAVRLKEGLSEITSKHFQLEGPGWENNHVAFRNYFDARNGIDIYGKKTTEMALDGAGINGQNYHVLDTWGMDILKVANSLGAGAIGMKIQDSLIRIGPDCKGEYKLLTEGALCSEFEFTFSDMKVMDRTYQISHKISIMAGANYYTSLVTIDGLKGDETFITGIVNKHSDSLYTDNTPKHAIFSTHDNQAFDGEVLGMAIAAQKGNVVGSFKAPDKGEGITETFVVEMKFDANNQVAFDFYSCWELQDNGFKDLNYFREFLKEDNAKKESLPVVNVAK